MSHTSDGDGSQLLALTHISVLQCAHVIGAISTHEGHIAQLFQASDDKFLHGRHEINGAAPVPKAPSAQRQGPERTFCLGATRANTCT